MQRSMQKRGALMATVVVASLPAWIAAHVWLQHSDRFTSFSVMVWPALAFVVFGAIGGLALTLIEGTADRLGAIGISWLAFLLIWQPDLWYFTTLPIFALLWMEGARRAHNDLADRRRIRIEATLGAGMQYYLLGIFLLVSVGFYLLPSSRQFSVGDLSEGIQVSVESTYNNALVREQLSQLPPQLQQQFRRDVSRAIDVTVREKLGPFGSFIPPLLAFALFLTLWSVAFLFRVGAVWLGTGLFAMLKKFGVIRVVTAQAPMETVEI